ncbi:MAG: carbonic anhydrase [Gammaproteobacteria bacterium]
MPELDSLIKGFRRFRQEYFIDNPELYQKLVEKGQKPKALIIACCDSRVHPAHITDTAPGEIFVVRNVANLVPPSVDDGKTHGTSAAIEFAVKHLKVPHIVVMGHSQCGGIRALMEGEHEGKTHTFIDPWMAIMKGAREQVAHEYAGANLDEQCRLCEKASIGVSLKNLLSFSFVASNIEAGKLKLHGWYFDIEQGQLFNREADGNYQPLAEAVMRS